jgi:hypothetical protein
LAMTKGLKGMLLPTTQVSGQTPEPAKGSFWSKCISRSDQRELAKYVERGG